MEIKKERKMELGLPSFCYVSNMACGCVIVYTVNELQYTHKDAMGNELMPVKISL